MHRYLFFVLLAWLGITGCSSTGVHDLQRGGATISTPPSVIFITPFTVRQSGLALGERTAPEKAALGREIVASLARRTASEVNRYAAPSRVLAVGAVPAAGTWVVRGEILEVNQGSRALRTGLGLGLGQTKFRTRVTVVEILPGRERVLLSFMTTGTSGLEPGAALGLATGAAAAQLAGGALLGSLAGVDSDIDRAAYEIAAVLSSYLNRHGLLSPSRQALSPNMAGQLPTSLNARRLIPGPLRETIAP